MGREFLCGEESICGQSLMRVWGHAPTENVRCSEIISVAPYKTHIIQEPKIKYGVGGGGGGEFLEIKGGGGEMLE